MIRRWPLVSCVLVQGLLIDLCLGLTWPAGAQNTAPADPNASNARAHPGNLAADSSANSPKEGVLPELNWEPRSDWINLRTGPSPQAIGDGAADDTAALQAALDRLSDNPGEPNTVYLPPGTYRITRTLAVRQKDGIAIIGHGRATRILWDGPGGRGEDARMFWSNGAPRSRYVGLTWDGQGRACVGFDHDSKGYFETEIDHQHEAYLNFTGSGIRAGHDQVQATAETTYVNCLFSNCESGLSLMQFNDYNHTLAGCEFRDCGCGINASAGPNFYVRDSHFERSRIVDVRARGEHSLSVRRCTSLTSRLFVEEATIAPLTIQDCQVSGWTNPSGAVRLGSGPVVLFDCVFTRPPTRHPPIVVSAGQHLVLSNNRSPDTEGLVKPGDSQHITEVPPGRIGASLASPDRRFLQSTVRIPGKVFDAKRDFGAKGDGKADDTSAIQSAIDAAREHGDGAMAYLPSGDYAIGKTLEVTGRDYCFGGSGTHSRLLWRGAEGGVLVRVHDPQHLALENLDIGSAGDQRNAADILQAGSGLPGSVRYERIWVFGMYRKQAGLKGFQARDLSAGTVIVADHFNGNVSLTDCARANLLFSSSYEGAVVVTGRKPQRDGLLGFMTRLATINTNGLYVQDSQSLVMSDYYVESADRMMEFHGNAEDPVGRVTIQMAKSHCSQNPVIQLENYRGQVALGPSMFYPGGIKPALITRRGSNPCDFILMACQAYEVMPKLDFRGAGASILLENTGASMGDNELPEGALERVATALDDLRRVGALDLGLNHDIQYPNHR
ncbi:MAG: glycosyl hydrolase family 28-related protein [Limisphaerales bacterium]